MDSELVFGKLLIGRVMTKLLDGREYLVCPVVAVKQGVLNTELLLAGEIEKSIVLWNDVPIPIPHPLENGEKVSAKDLNVIEESVVGRFYNAYYENESLKGELWIDVEKAEKLGDDALKILKRLRKGDPVEVSTAYYSDTDLSETGMYNGKQYVGVQHNIRPDHIALLPEGIGACSWADGCGAPRVNELELVDNPYPNEASCRLVDPGKFQKGSYRAGTRKHDGKTYRVLMARLKGKTKLTDASYRYPSKTWTTAAARAHCTAHKGIKFEPATGVKTMELSIQLREGESYNDRNEAVEAAIRDKVIPSGSSDWYVYISDLYENSVIYQVTEPDQARQYFQAPYIVGDNLEVTLGEPVAVKRKVSYTTLKAHIKSTARTPSYVGTESTKWTGPTLDDMITGYVKAGNEKPESNLVKDLPAKAKTWIASKTLLGDAGADTTADLIFFPCVNPSTNKLNEGALRAVISGRGAQAKIPAGAKKSAQTKARSLLVKEFGMKAEQEGLIEKIIGPIKNLVKNLLEVNQMTEREKLIKQLQDNDADLNLDLLENADDELLQYMVGQIKSVESEGNESEGNESKGNESEGNKSEGNKSEDNEPEGDKAKGEPETNTVKDQISANEYREILEFSRAQKTALGKEKKDLVDSLVANKHCSIDKVNLEKMEFVTLKQLASDYQPGNYLGAGVVKRNMESIPAPPAILLAKGGK